MKLKFKIQQYQTDAVQNVVKVFNGQPNKGLAEYIVDKGKTYIKENGKITSHQAEILLQVKQRRARVILREMVEAGMQENM